MAEVIYKVVSNVDTVILLKNPATVFAEWVDAIIPEAEPPALTVGENTLRNAKEGKKAMVTSWDEPSAMSIDEQPQEVDDWGFPIRQELADDLIREEPVDDWATWGTSSWGVSNKKKGKKGMKAAAPPVCPEELLEPADEESAIPSDSGPSNVEQSIFGIGLSNGDSMIPSANDINTEPPVTETRPEQPAKNASLEEQVNDNDNSYDNKIETPVEEGGIHYHVCSGNLMSASPWFNRVLKKDGWMESNRDSEDGRFRISAADWDSEAFLILLNIFHLQNEKVPEKVTLEMLAKIAVLVDYYECAPAVKMHIRIWIEDLKKTAPIPTTYCRDLILWMWVSCVFALPEQFTQTTIVAIQQCTESVQSLGLPISPRISGEIDSKRYQAIEAVISDLHHELDTYRSANYVCSADDTYSFQCGSFLLGALTKGLDGLNLPSPRPEVPFAGMSFQDICGKIRLMESPEWYDHVSDRRHYHSSPHDCNLNTTVTYIVDRCTAGIAGLSLNLLNEGD